MFLYYLPNPKKPADAGFAFGAKGQCGQSRRGQNPLSDWSALLRALDLAGLHAAGADVRLADAALLVADGDLLDVRTEHAVGHSMGVAHATTERRCLAANFANLRHNSQLRVRAG